MIRNGCVNDGTPASGNEARNVDVLADLLAGPGIDVKAFEPTPGRRSLVARIDGEDPSAPALCLLGHTDVVPVNAERWSRDPFGGELVDDEIWGRGAIDMLNLTVSMASAMRRLADAGFKPKGSLIFVAAADEEAAGEHGTGHLVANHWDDVACSWLVTEGGGWPQATPAGPALQLAAGEKGWWWGRLRVRGRAGHASRPYGSANAVETAAEVVRRLASVAPEAEVHDLWRRWVSSMGFDAATAEALLDARRIDETIASLPSATATLAHACTHTTVVPTVVHGGVRANVIPDEVMLEVDARLLPGLDVDAVETLVRDALADLPVDVEGIGEPATLSAVDTPLFAALEGAAKRLRPEVRALPTLMAGGTDARFFRRRGVTAYGFGVWSGRHDAEELGRMFHGDDERIDLESLRLTTQLWEYLAKDLLT
jgi:acetylornithine deacetylase/succinyl-diaminopimelate desuccinylase-like protein